MIYPAVIMFVAVGIVTLLMMVVVPQFQSIFQQMLRGRSSRTDSDHHQYQ